MKFPNGFQRLPGVGRTVFMPKESLSVDSVGRTLR